VIVSFGRLVDDAVEVAVAPRIEELVDSANSLDIRCAECDKLLAHYDPNADTHRPSPEELLRDAKVPVPNFGWFCNQHCGKIYTERTGIEFDRDAGGNIRYYK
jgi:hypothetical protein